MTTIDIASKAELKACSGAGQKSGVAAWCRMQGVRYALGKDGWPRVMRDELRQLLLTGEREKRQARHNFDALAEPRARA